MANWLSPNPFEEEICFVVRSGKGTVADVALDPSGGEFTDQVGTACRVPRRHQGWDSVTYKGRRYQLFGGVRTSHFIDLSNPI